MKDYRGEGRKLLDYGGVVLVDYMGNDLSVVRAARTSHQAAWRTGVDEGKDEKLIRFMMAHRHTTPFESVVFTFEVKAPIFVFRQWHRHRTQSYSEVSARYSMLPNEMYVPEIDMIGKQCTWNKQSRTIGELSKDEREFLEESLRMYMDCNEKSYETYRLLLEKYQWPRELARAVLPFATYSSMFTTLNLHNTFHFLGLRMDPHAQYEIRVFADTILELIKPVLPIAVSAWIDGQKNWKSYNQFLQFMPNLEEMMKEDDEELAIRKFLEVRKGFRAA